MNLPKYNGKLTLSIIFFLCSVILLLLLPSQTQVVNRPGIFTQPWFWPGVALVVMCTFATVYCVTTILQQCKQTSTLAVELKELVYWLRPLEYALWFLVYVWLVPLLGYLLSTILFCCALSTRVGYRRLRDQLLAIAFAFVVVVIFKMLLQVNIPAGAIYDALPNPYRSFMMSNF